MKSLGLSGKYVIVKQSSQDGGFSDFLSETRSRDFIPQSRGTNECLEYLFRVTEGVADVGRGIHNLPPTWKENRKGWGEK